MPENVIKLAKKQNNKHQSKIRLNCKILFRVKCKQISYKEYLIIACYYLSAIER